MYIFERFGYFEITGYFEILKRYNYSNILVNSQIIKCSNNRLFLIFGSHENFEYLYSDIVYLEILIAYEFRIFNKKYPDDNLDFVVVL